MATKKSINRLAEALMESTYPKTADDSRHHVQHLCIASCGNVTVVVAENRVEQWRHEVRVHGFEILSLLNEGLHELEDLLLDCPQMPDFRGLRGDQACKKLG